MFEVSKGLAEGTLFLLLRGIFIFWICTHTPTATISVEECFCLVLQCPSGKKGITGYKSWL